jgi:hypothetical protein
MTVQKIIEGLMIIQKSKPETESDYHAHAGHEEMWAGNLQWELSEKDEKRLNELGWTKDNENNAWHAHI